MGGRVGAMWCGGDPYQGDRLSWRSRFEGLPINDIIRRAFSNRNPNRHPTQLHCRETAAVVLTLAHTHTRHHTFTHAGGWGGIHSVRMWVKMGER